METSPLDRQLQSVQRNITFLKGEHVDLLHGLHMEILQLQKRCTELTYELALKPPKSDQSDPAEWEVNCEPLEAKISEKELENSALRRELYHKEALISALEDSMRKRERMFLEELKKRSHRVTVLSSELQKQSDTAASLSFQLRSAKQRLSSSRASSQPRDKPPVWDRPLPTSPVYVAVSQKRSCKSHSRKSELGCADRAAGRETGRQRRDVCWDELDPMPDPELFLQARWRYGQQQQQQQQQTSAREPRLGLSALGSSYQTPRTVPALLTTTTDTATSPLTETEIPLTDEEADKD
ncbi:coiled-coil domain-containing protein 92 [Callorhinchus milii]|uniref:Coiled-coil domain containing 92B n=1 Tax=Callorhinchus milii TaxID=7868 RepID=A0A4W3IGA4_CALMI|nr:coiled-coil domain-containing protein 92 [Callorhinchus milii]|eukprot:gi/632965639/ref/XP_007898991.1/ PREDICTED: coiled-coil domain-containing protein 92 [Callorhinchus milii]